MDKLLHEIFLALTFILALISTTLTNDSAQDVQAQTALLSNQPIINTED